MSDPEHKKYTHLLETPSEKRRRLGMIGDMKSLNLAPSETTQEKLKYYYNSYNHSALKTHYMRFDQEDANFTEEQKMIRDKAIMLVDETGLCWKRISDFILNADRKEFDKVLERFQNKDVAEIKENIKKSQEVFK